MNLDDQAGSCKRPPWLYAASATLVPTLFFGLLFLDLFPLVEFRDWVADPLTWSHLLDHSRHALLRDRLFDRDLAMAYAQLAGRIGGTDIRVLNAVMLAPFAGACLLIYLLARKLTLPPLAGLAAVGFFAFSLPALDALSWQATGCDRLALMFSLLALHTTLGFQAKPWSWTTLAWSNLLVLLWVFSAFNSKLSSLFLAPALALAPFLHAGRTGKEYLARLGFLVAPLGYAAFHLLTYLFMLRSDAQSAAHVLGRSLSEVPVQDKIGHLLGFPGHTAPTTAMVLFSGFCAVLLVPMLLRRIPRPGQAPCPLSVRAVPWLAFCLVLSIGTTLFTKYDAPYNQYLPRALFALLATLGIVRLFESTLPLRRRRIATAISLAVLFAGSLIPFQKYGLARALKHMQVSRNFVASFQTIQSHLDPSRAEPLEIDVFGPAGKVYKFYSGSRRGLMRFVLGDAACADLPWSEPVTALTDLDVDKWRPPGGARGYRLCYDRHLRLFAIYRDEMALFSKAPGLPGKR